MLVCFFNSLPNGEYSNILIAFCDKSISCKTPFPVKESYLPTFPDDKAETFFYLNGIELCFARFYY